MLHVDAVVAAAKDGAFADAVTDAVTDAVAVATVGVLCREEDVNDQM